MAASRVGSSEPDARRGIPGAVPGPNGTSLDCDGVHQRHRYRRCDHFARLGVSRDPDEIAHGLWMAFMFADL